MMVYSLTTTELFRTYRYVESDFSLFNLVQREFGGLNGDQTLALVLGISISQAASILSFYEDRAYCRVAYQYGLMPDENNATSWRVLPMCQEPANAGPPLRWTPRLVMYLQELFSIPSQQPSLERLAWRMDTTPRRLRDGMKKHGITLPLKEHVGTWLDERSTMTWSDLITKRSEAKPTQAKRLHKAAVTRAFSTV